MPSTNGKLTQKQKKFVEEYLIDLNATQAAIRAGYSVKTAEWIGPQLLGKSHVSKEIQRATWLREQRTRITQDRVVEEIARLGFSDLRKRFDANGNLKPLHELDDDTTAALAGIDVVVTGDGENVLQVKKIKLWDKNIALEKLAKHLRLWTERHEHTGLDGSPIEVKIRAFLDKIDGTERFPLEGGRGV